jgi:hypothetical protein
MWPCDIPGHRPCLCDLLVICPWGSELASVSQHIEASFASLTFWDCGHLNTCILSYIQT